MKIAQVKNLENAVWDGGLDIAGEVRAMIHDVAEKMAGCVCPDCSKVVGSARSLEVLLTEVVMIGLAHDDDGEVIEDVDLGVVFGSELGLKRHQAKYAESK